MKNLTRQNPRQLIVAQELINKVKSKCCGIKDEIYNDQDTVKFIPILRKGNFGISTPDFIDGRKGFDCTTSEKYQKELTNIVKTIKGEPIIEIPPIK